MNAQQPLLHLEPPPQNPQPPYQPGNIVANRNHYPNQYPPPGGGGGAISSAVVNPQLTNPSDQQPIHQMNVSNHPPHPPGGGGAISSAVVNPQQINLPDQQLMYQMNVQNHPPPPGGGGLVSHYPQGMVYLNNSNYPHINNYPHIKFNNYQHPSFNALTSVPQVAPYNPQQTHQQGGNGVPIAHNSQQLIPFQNNPQQTQQQADEIPDDPYLSAEQNKEANSNNLGSNNLPSNYEEGMLRNAFEKEKRNLPFPLEEENQDKKRSLSEMEQKLNEGKFGEPKRLGWTSSQEPQEPQNQKPPSKLKPFRKVQLTKIDKADYFSAERQRRLLERQLLSERKRIGNQNRELKQPSTAIPANSLFEHSKFGQVGQEKVPGIVEWTKKYNEALTEQKRFKDEQMLKEEKQRENNEKLFAEFRKLQKRDLEIRKIKEQED